MSCDWGRVPLSSLGKIVTGKTPPSKVIDAFVNGSVPFVTPRDLDDRKWIKTTERYLSNTGLESVKGNIVPAHSVAVSCIGSDMGKARLLSVKSVTNQQINTILVNSELHNPEYIYYVLSTKQQSLKDIAGGSATPILNKSHFGQFEIDLPSKGYQDAVVDVLRGLDSKIEINTQTNQTLEQMAQAIFKSWFVDFDPVKAKMRGEQPEGMDEATASLFPEKLDSETGIPEGWKLSEIGDEVTVVGGGTPSTKNDDFWLDGDIHWTSPKDLSGVQDKVLLDTASKVTEAGLKKISSGLLPVDTVLLSSRAPVGYLALAKVPMAINQGYIAMKCEKQLPPEFVLQWCVHRMDEIKQRASGSTFAEISKKSFKPISVIIPNADVLCAYQRIVKPLYDAITSNARQNEQLSSLRDTLLPKLLSGEVAL